MRCLVPIEKFTEYVFKPGATHGKDQVFAALGYGHEDSDLLARIYAQEAEAEYLVGKFALDRRDVHGQHITIVVKLGGIAEYAGKQRTLRTGWMLGPDDSLRLVTPFSGYADSAGDEDAG